MAKIGTEEAMFCEGCPVQEAFVGEVTEDSLVFGVKLDHDFSTETGVWITTKFRDVDGMESAADKNLIKSEDFADFGLPDPQRTRQRVIKNRKQIEKIATEKVEEIAPRLVQRIGRCAHVGVKGNKPFCPALEPWNVIKTMLKQDVESSQQQTA